VDGKQFFVDEERLLGRWCAKDDVYHSGRAENNAMQKLVKASLKIKRESRLRYPAQFQNLSSRPHIELKTGQENR